MPNGHTVPVLWVNHNPQAATRGYWDQGMLEALLDGSLWRVPGTFTYQHHDLGADAWPQVEGAVVVVPARHNAAAGAVDTLNAQLAALSWVLLVLTGDEAGEFPWSRLVLPERNALWVMGARPHARPPQPHTPLGSGWPPWYRAELPVELPAKELDFAFAGQVTHARRMEAARAMRDWTGPCARLETKSFTSGVPPAEYAQVMARAKVAPCPSGPENPDSFRLYEALEAGCIPVADAATPRGPDPAYWTYVMGEPPPFPEVLGWEALPAILREQLDAWPGNANTVSAWWSGWKRRLAWRWHDALVELVGAAPALEPAEEVTVVVPASPSPLHPDTAHLDATLASVRAHLPDSEVLVVLDPPRPELKARTEAWEEFVRRVCWKAHREWRNVAVDLRPQWGHEANAVRAAVAQVRTPLTLLVEYDAPLVVERPISWAAISAAIHSGVAQQVRFLHEAQVLEDHQHLVVGPAELVEGVPMVPTMQYSSRPHVAPTWFYQEVLEQHFPPESRTMIEDHLYGVINRRGVSRAAWERWRIWIYADTSTDGSMQRSYHLDGRQDDPKYDMQI